MKFKVREGFVVRITTIIDLGNGEKQPQESSYFPGQTVEMDAATADQHLHKLEPADKAAAAYAESKVLPATTSSQLGITPEMAAFAKALAAEMVAAAKAPAASEPAA